MNFTLSLSPSPWQQAAATVSSTEDDLREPHPSPSQSPPTAPSPLVNGEAAQVPSAYLPAA